MEINEVNIPCQQKYGERFDLIPIGDIHYGNWQCDTEYFENLIDWIKHQKNILVLGMGDYCECITPTDKRFDMDSTTEYRPAEQYHYIYKQFKKIQDKIIGIHIGHHGDTLRLHAFDNYDLKLANDLGVKYLDWHAFNILNFNYKTTRNITSRFVVYSCHGNGGGSTTGAKVNKVEELAKFYDADIYLMGHLHKCLTTTDNQISLINGLRGNRLTTRKRIFAVTGTMLRYPIEGKSGYEARKGYRPMKPGVVKIKLYPRIRERRTGIEGKDMHISE